jgi:hypothetical protein
VLENSGFKSFNPFYHQEFDLIGYPNCFDHPDQLVLAFLMNSITLLVTAPLILPS